MHFEYSRHLRRLDTRAEEVNASIFALPVTRVTIVEVNNTLQAISIVCSNFQNFCEKKKIKHKIGNESKTKLNWVIWWKVSILSEGIIEAYISTVCYALQARGGKQDSSSCSASDHLMVSPVSNCPKYSTRYTQVERDSLYPAINSLLSL